MLCVSGCLYAVFSGVFADCMFRGVSVCGLCVSGCFCILIVFQGVSIHCVFEGISVC